MARPRSSSVPAPYHMPHDAPNRRILIVDDNESIHADIRAILEPPADKPWGLREMRIRDPDGVGIYLVQVPDDHPLRLRR